MTTATDYYDWHRKTANALQNARSPKSWQSSLSAALKPSFALLYGYRWITQLELEPTLKQGPLLGNCLQQVLCDDPIDEDDNDKSTESSTRAFGELGAGDPCNKNVKLQTASAFSAKAKLSSKASDVATKPNKSSSVNGTPKSRSASQLKQLLTQQKTATVTSLQHCLKVNNKETGDTGVEHPTKNRKNANKVVELPSQKNANKLATSKDNINCNKQEWQQQISRQIEKIITQKMINRTINNNLHPNTSKNPSLSKQEAFKNNLWQDNLVGSKPRASLQLLELSTHTNIPVIANDLSARNRPQPNGLNTAESNNHHAPVAKSVSDNLQSLLPPIKAKTNTIEATAHKKDANHHAQKSAAIETAAKDDTPNPTSGITDKLTKSDAYQVSPERPEFPPVAKMINQQLQPSGKRTALVRESQSLLPHEHEIDDEKLADALKRIIDEQARRHGIHV